jgi:MFS family permease
MNEAKTSRAYSVYVLVALLVVYTFNFIDRIILGVVLVPIKAELALTDGQLGLLGGLAFALLYTVAGIPIGWLADRVSRVWIIAVALAIWSGFTALCGSASSFLQLFLCRVGVGIGEAGGVAPSYSLITDYFSPRSRARAISVYSFGIPIGAALGLYFGGYVATQVSWRAAFLWLGIAGLVLVPFLLLTVREPVRGALDTGGAPAPATAKPRFTEVWRVLARKRAFWGLSLGAACSSIVGYGIFFWLPSFFVRSYHMNLSQMAVFYGTITLVGGVTGVWFGGWLGDWLGTRRKAAYAIVPAVAFLVCLPFYVFGVLASGMSWTAVVFVIPAALSLVWLGPTIAAIQHCVPPSMRAMASAIFLFVNNFIGLGAGTYLIGFLSDEFAGRYGENSLRYAILACTSFYLLSAMFFLLSARRLERDWE